MSEEQLNRGVDAFSRVLKARGVTEAANELAGAGTTQTPGLLGLARAICEASGDEETAGILAAELQGYDNTDQPIPERRKVPGYASPFPVRAIGLLDPEEIFLANREKFSQVTLTIGQPIHELELALEQIQEGGVLALRVPASDVSGEAVTTDDDTEVFIYIMPREIERVVDGARWLVLDVLSSSIVSAATDLTDFESTTSPSPDRMGALSADSDTLDADDVVEFEAG